MSTTSGYISGGKLSGNTCQTCDYRYPDPQYISFGWCTKRDFASVSSSGYCQLHSAEEGAPPSDEQEEPS